MRATPTEFMARLLHPRAAPLPCLSVRSLLAQQLAPAIEGLAAGALYADQEHGSLDAVEAGRLVRLAEAGGHLGFARAPGPGLAGLEALVQAGVTAVLIPGIHARRDAQALAEATQRLRNAGLLPGLMIESPQALAECEAIAAIPAFGFFMLGCADLRRRAAADTTDTESLAEQAIGRLTRAARSQGKGMMVGGTWTQPRLQAAAVQAGVDLLTVGSDLGCLRQGLLAVMPARQQPALP